MSHEKHYTCSRRYQGICGGGPKPCGDDSFNVICEYYTPCHVIGFTAVIYPPEEARRIKSELQEKFRASRNPPASPVVLTGPSAE